MEAKTKKTSANRRRPCLSCGRYSSEYTCSKCKVSKKREDMVGGIDEHHIIHNLRKMGASYA